MNTLIHLHNTRFDTFWKVSTIGGLLAGLAAILSLGFGLADVSWRLALGDVLGALGLEVAGSAYPTVIVDLRLPRALAGACVGGALGVSGCLLQALMRNPLASPAVIGSAQGATFGALLAIALGAAQIATLASACTMALLAVMLVLALSRGSRAMRVEAVVLNGMAMALLFFALANLTRSLTRDEYALGRMGLWLTGGLWHATWSELSILGPLTACGIGLSFFFARPLDLLTLGESDAQRLGLRVQWVGAAVVLISCILTGLAICLGGMVAFVGLIVPHACRWLVGPRHAVLLPASASLGAVLVIGADTLARTVVPPQELPLTVVTSLVGVPAFLILLRAMHQRRVA